MIQMLSDASAARPIVCPSTQPFGSGFGQKGSTSNFGACAPAASTTARLPSTIDPVPRTAATATTATPTYKLRLIDASPPGFHAHLPLEDPVGYTSFFPQM